MNKTNTVLEVSGLQVRYDAFTAVKDVSFSVQTGEIFGLLGPNGAGKTSSLAAIEGLIKPADGIVHIDGVDALTHTAEAKMQLGVQLQKTSFQPELTIYEIIRLYAGLYGVELTRQQIDERLQTIGLEGQGKKRFGQFSGGQQQRVSLLVATIHNPKLVLLDEPTTGLDPQSRRQLWETVETIRQEGRSVVLTTHSMEEAQAVCDRIAIVDHGEVIATDTPEGLIKRYKDDPAVRKQAHGAVTLEDVFIGLTGNTIR